MDSTMDLIQRLSNERYALWLKAGRHELGDEERWRLQQLTRELGKLWDAYRRELAGGNRSQPAGMRDVSRSKADLLKQAA